MQRSLPRLDRHSASPQGTSSGVLDATPASSEHGHQASARPSPQRAFEVVVHQGEAFLQVIQGLEGDDEPARNKGVLDYATGWQHHVALFTE